jgi:hypothetical protein
MNFMQNTNSARKLSLGNAFSFATAKQHSRCDSTHGISSCSSACTSDYDHDNSFNYDSEDADANLLVGQALQYCEATRGGKKKQFNNVEERN